ELPGRHSVFGRAGTVHTGTLQELLLQAVRCADHRIHDIYTVSLCGHILQRLPAAAEALALHARVLPCSADRPVSFQSAACSFEDVCTEHGAGIYPARAVRLDCR